MERDENKLDFQMQHQLADFWCWAAVARTVSHFYETANHPSPHDQCGIVNAVLGADNNYVIVNCCPDHDANDCDNPYLLEKALRFTENHRLKRPVPIRWETLVREIDDGKVVCARIEWNKDEAHFISITGYTGNVTGDQWVFVDDPQGGERHMPFDTLLTNYENRENSGGKYTDTYFTKSQFTSR